MNKARQMVQIIQDRYGFDDSRVLLAMQKVPREKFIPKSARPLAYSDNAIPIGEDQTISQPFTVAFMTHLLDLKGEEKVLEIGTGSGYQAAVLSHLAKKVYTIERVNSLCQKARTTLKKHGFKNIKVRCGKGELGWKKYSPFDAIIVTAEILDKVPKSLISQLKDGGVLVAPIKGIMYKITKKKRKLKKEPHGRFSFVPLVEE